MSFIKSFSKILFPKVFSVEDKLKNEVAPLLLVQLQYIYIHQQAISRAVDILNNYYGSCISLKDFIGELEERPDQVYSLRRFRDACVQLRLKNNCQSYHLSH